MDPVVMVRVYESFIVVLGTNFLQMQPGGFSNQNVKKRLLKTMNGSQCTRNRSVSFYDKRKWPGTLCTCMCKVHCP